MPTYRSCYEQFRLADRGVSYYVFYRYARNLRRQAALIDLAEARSPEDTDPVAPNEAVTVQMLWRLIEAGDDETADSHVLLRLAKAHHLCLRTQRMMRDDHDRELSAFLKLKVPNGSQGKPRPSGEKVVESGKERTSNRSLAVGFGARSAWGRFEI